jgi:hypothetical protein
MIIAPASANSRVLVCAGRRLQTHAPMTRLAMPTTICIQKPGDRSPIGRRPGSTAALQRRSPALSISNSTAPCFSAA